MPESNIPANLSAPLADRRASGVFAVLLRAFAKARQNLSVESGGEAPAVPVPGDLLGELNLGEDFAAFLRPWLAQSYMAEPGVAIRDEDEQNPGKHKISFRTRDGEETSYRGLQPTNRPELAPVLPPREPWGTLQDTSAAPHTRLAALNELVGSPQEADAVAYLAGQLLRSDLSGDWRDAVVFALEAVSLPLELRPGVGDRLLVIAADLRTQPEGKDKVVWSALRRGASLLVPNQVEQLLVFLSPTGFVDTRSVALQSIARVYELSAPDAVPAALTDRAYAFAVKFLDPDVFAAGEPSLIARNAITALAAMGDARLQVAIDLVAVLARPWLAQRVREQLARLRGAWQERHTREDHPAFLNLNAALARLQ